MGRNDIKLHRKTHLLPAYICTYYRDLKTITGDFLWFTGSSVQLEKIILSQVDQKYFFPEISVST